MILAAVVLAMIIIATPKHRIRSKYLYLRSAFLLFLVLAMRVTVKWTEDFNQNRLKLFVMAELELATPQARATYDLLASRNDLTAKEIGECLGILPNAVYRAADQLLSLGVVKKQGSYPARYSLVPVGEALGWFLLTAQRSFKEAFQYSSQQPLAGALKGPSMTFIRTRENLLKRTDQDAARAAKSIDFIVSGLEVPDETVIAFRKAVAKGVRVRALLQKRKETSKAKLEKWADLGADVRLTDDHGVRMFLFDTKTAYMTSYNQGKKEEAFGVRFDFAPLAVMLQDVFELRWNESEIESPSIKK